MTIPTTKGLTLKKPPATRLEPSLDEAIGIYNSMFFQKGYDFTDETDPNPKLNNGESTSVVITDISEVSDIMTAVVYSIVYPTPTPSSSPTPTPVPDKEMILEVEINEVDATNNDIVVSKGDWVLGAGKYF